MWAVGDAINLPCGRGPSRHHVCCLTGTSEPAPPRRYRIVGGDDGRATSAGARGSHRGNRPQEARCPGRTPRPWTRTRRDRRKPRSGQPSAHATRAGTRERRLRPLGALGLAEALLGPGTMLPSARALRGGARRGEVSVRIAGLLGLHGLGLLRQAQRALVGRGRPFRTGGALRAVGGLLAGRALLGGRQRARRARAPAGRRSGRGPARPGSGSRPARRPAPRARAARGRARGARKPGLASPPPAPARAGPPGARGGRPPRRSRPLRRRRPRRPPRSGAWRCPRGLPARTSRRRRAPRCRRGP